MTISFISDSGNRFSVIKNPENPDKGKTKPTYTLSLEVTMAEGTRPTIEIAKLFKDFKYAERSGESKQMKHSRTIVLDDDLALWYEYVTTGKDKPL